MVNENFAPFIPYIGLAIGVFARVILPWWRVRLEEGGKWDWNMAIGQIIAGVGAFIMLLAANPDLPTMDWRSALGIGLASALGGWGAADIGRTTKKTQE